MDKGAVFSTAKALPQTKGAGLDLALRIVLVGLLLRTGIAVSLPLGTDEVYAIAAARELSWSYFDHPPLVFFLSRATSWLWDGAAVPPLAYRLPFLLLGTVTAWAICQLATDLAGERAAKWAAVLWCFTPVFVLTAGTGVTPDGPLCSASLVAAWALTKALRTSALRYWVLCGIGLGVALASKYHALLVATGFLAYLALAIPRELWLRNKGFWLAVSIALAGLLPVLIWGVLTQWQSFQFHAGRTGAQLQVRNFVVMMVLQLVYLMPATFVLCVAGLLTKTRAALRPGHEGALHAGPLLWITSIMLLVPFGLAYLGGRDTYPHWTLLGWLFALPLGAGWLASLTGLARHVAIVGIVVSSLVTAATITALTVQSRTGFLTRGHPDAKLDGWLEFIELHALREELASGGWLDGVQSLAARDWSQAGFISHAMHSQWPVQVLGPDARHFQYHEVAGRREPAVLVVYAPVRHGEQLHAQARDLASRSGAIVMCERRITQLRGGRPHIAIVLLKLRWPRHAEPDAAAPLPEECPH